ncbi:MAG TPA: hypothetical protein PLR26_01035 [Bacilli bacterium]|nr:hypothetical protein [Bacilli bacterium]
MSKKDIVQNLDNYILPIPGEKYVKIYNCINLSDSSGEGIIGITNERLIFIGKSKTSKESSTTTYEIPIHDVGAIRSGFGRTVNLKRKNIGTWLLVIGLLIAAFGAVLSFTTMIPVQDILYGYIGLGVGAILSIVGIVILSGNVKKQFYVEICTNKPINTFFLAKSFGLSASDVNVIYASPTKETNQMLKEIGSVIATAKKMTILDQIPVDQITPEPKSKESNPFTKKVPLEQIPPLPKEGKKIRGSATSDPFEKPIIPTPKKDESNPFAKPTDTEDFYSEEDDSLIPIEKDPLKRSAFGSILSETKKDEDTEEDK